MSQILLGTWGYKVSKKNCFLSSEGSLLYVRHNPVSRQLQHDATGAVTYYYWMLRKHKGCECRLQDSGKIELMLVPGDVGGFP